MERVGIDIGGTFTDLVGYRDGAIVIGKTSTTVDEPTHGVIDSLVAADVDVSLLVELLHGSTIAINTVLERKGAPTSLLTTRGFRDVYAIGRSNRPDAFNLDFKRPRPLIPRSLTFELEERMNAKGEPIVPLNETQVEDIARMLVERGVRSVAVCLLHAYANPAHERKVGEILSRISPGLFVTLSHEILREYREYERTSTTVLNAYVGPRVRVYLERLHVFLHERRFCGGIQIMRSNGGTMSFAQARAQPVSMMESGPVAGMIAAGRIASLLGLSRCVGFDMGGTTAKASLITDGKPEIREGYHIGGYASGQPMQLPVVDITEIGAGGGSLAWCDVRGALHVGPQSAGADPGPACYGRGGSQPVVTDANLMLGRLNPGRFLSGRMALDRLLSETAIRTQVAERLGLSVPEAAHGIVRIADASMSLAVRGVSVERGCDPRDCVMIAFGGAGPLHAVSIAREIFMPRVVIPRYPGNFSAVGMLLAPWRDDLVLTYVADLADVNAASIGDACDTLRSTALKRVEEEGVAPEAATFQFSADLRYRGQEHTIPVPFSKPADLEHGGSRSLRLSFDELHDRRYGHAAPAETVQLVNLRLTVSILRQDTQTESWLSAPFAAEDARPEQRRDVIFDNPGRPLTARVLWRPGLEAGSVIEGPAVIEEPNSTILIHPGDRATVTAHGHLDLVLGKTNAREERS